MRSKIAVNLEDLLRQRSVEGDRIEYKAGWNPDSIIRSISAFANDFENLGRDSQSPPKYPPSSPQVTPQVLLVSIEEGLIEMTIPDRPQSSKQQYRLTEKGKRLKGK
ncbi:MAG: Fic family protein [Pseudobdellovibrionaceae bacterium]